MRLSMLGGIIVFMTDSVPHVCHEYNYQIPMAPDDYGMLLSVYWSCEECDCYATSHPTTCDCHVTSHPTTCACHVTSHSNSCNVMQLLILLNVIVM